MRAHDQQQIVKVVGDAAGEATDGLHFLRLAELVFQSVPFTDITKNAQESASLAAEIQERIGDFQIEMFGIPKLHARIESRDDVAILETPDIGLDAIIKAMAVVSDGKDIAFELFP